MFKLIVTSSNDTNIKTFHFKNEKDLKSIMDDLRESSLSGEIFLGNNNMIMFNKLDIKTLLDVYSNAYCEEGHEKYAKTIQYPK